VRERLADADVAIIPSSRTASVARIDFRVLIVLGVEAIITPPTGGA
jgi:hypothetical protein